VPRGCLTLCIETHIASTRHGISNLFIPGVCALVLSAVITAQTPAAPSPSSTQSARSRFPDGPGREALFKVCNDCHGPESVLGHLKTREEWNKTLDEMAGNGATGSDEEWNQILEYLVTHYSLIVVNEATAKDLAVTLDVSSAVAETIVQARTEKGRLTSIDDLKQVAGGDAAPKIDARKDRLVF
jgi:competence protein ComEA